MVLIPSHPQTINCANLQEHVFPLWDTCPFAQFNGEQFSFGKKVGTHKTLLNFLRFPESSAFTQYFLDFLEFFPFWVFKDFMYVCMYSSERERATRE